MLLGVLVGEEYVVYEQFFGRSLSQHVKEGFKETTSFTRIMNAAKYATLLSFKGNLYFAKNKQSLFYSPNLQKD